MRWDVSIFRESNAVPTHFCDYVLTKNNYLLGTILDATRVRAEDCSWYLLHESINDGVGDSRSSVSEEKGKKVLLLLLLLIKIII